MAKVPLPDRGQPLDVTYLYQIANALNDAVDTISTATYNYTTVDTRGIGKTSLKNNNAKLYAAYVDVVSGEAVSANQTKPWSLNFDSNFKYPPIVTATVVNGAVGVGSAIGNDIIVSINNTTTSLVSGVLRFNSSGTVTVSINILAIGIPA